MNKCLKPAVWIYFSGVRFTVAWTMILWCSYLDGVKSKIKIEIMLQCFVRKSWFFFLSFFSCFFSWCERFDCSSLVFLYVYVSVYICINCAQMCCTKKKLSNWIFLCYQSKFNLTNRFWLLCIYFSLSIINSTFRHGIVCQFLK